MPESDSDRGEIAEAFDRDLDPLAEYSATFEEVNADPFMIFRSEILEPRELSSKTLADYERVFKQWRAHMTEEGRHPACPSEGHVRAFIRRELRENGTATVKRKLAALNSAYEFWQDDAGFPHPHDYDPFAIASQKETFPDSQSRDLPRIGLDELRCRVGDVTHHRDRAILALQLKCGLRAGEVCNIKIGDLTTGHPELRQHYSEFGSHPMLEDRQNALYIPSRDERGGNKSRRPRLLPLDDELRRVLLRYLLVRPQPDSPWLFLSKRRHQQLVISDPGRIWEDAFHPEYAETDRHKPVTSHFGRHWFTTYWQVEQDLNAELVGYMRGDKAGRSVEDHGAIQHYIHTYYDDIENLYLDQIFKLDI